MVQSESVFAGSVPAIYERLMVPMLFDPFAQHMADRVAQMSPREILETAAGTGAMTRAMAARLPPDAQIIATDLNPAMLDLARAAGAAEARISWQQADAQSLPRPDRSADCVVCQFGVMFFPDRVQAYREVLRVLRPGAPFLFSTWDQVAHNAFVAVVQRALDVLFHPDPPRFMQRIPHGYHDTFTVAQDLRAAGFGPVRVEAVTLMVRAASAQDAAAAYCQGTPLRAEIEARGPGRLEEVTQIVADALSRTFGPGQIKGQAQAFIVTATA